MNPDFVDLLRAFVEHDVRFLVVGAYALARHGRPRATGDLDVWVDATPENAPRVMRALAAFGAPMRDILTQLTGITFAEAWPDRVAGPFGDLTVDFIGREAFIRNKRATGRARDLGDVEDLD